MPVIRALALSGLALNFITTAFDVVFVLYAYTAVETGGLGFTVINEFYFRQICTNFGTGIADRSLSGDLWSNILRHADHPPANSVIPDPGNEVVQHLHVYMVSDLHVTSAS
jgi:hypothetical protein